MSNADQWLVLAVRNVSSVSDLAACRVGASLLRVPSAENATAQKSDVANVPDAPIYRLSYYFLPRRRHEVEGVAEVEWT